MQWKLGLHSRLRGRGRLQRWRAKMVKWKFLGEEFVDYLPLYLGRKAVYRDKLDQPLLGQDKRFNKGNLKAQKQINVDLFMGERSCRNKEEFTLGFDVTNHYKIVWVKMGAWDRYRLCRTRLLGMKPYVHPELSRKMGITRDNLNKQDRPIYHKQGNLATMLTEGECYCLPG